MVRLIGESSTIGTNFDNYHLCIYPTCSARLDIFAMGIARPDELPAVPNNKDLLLLAQIYQDLSSISNDCEGGYNNSCFNTQSSSR